MENRTNLQKLETYYNIFLSIVQDHRRTITSIAKYIGHTGRGKRRATVSNYLHEMYDKKISLKPNLILKSFTDPERRVYLCKGENRDNIWDTFEDLRADERISYVVLISGDCDFFITSNDPNLNVSDFDLQVTESSMLYSPIYTVPHGLKTSFSNATKKIINFPFKPGKLNRKAKGTLQWSDIDVQIFQSMRKDARQAFSQVADLWGVAPNTVKTHYFNSVLPSCKIAHYFFPRGYDHYHQSLFRIQTKYENSFVKALRMLPTTVYVYPFESGLCVNFFHDNINILMTLMGKMEEKRVIKSFTLYTPLWHNFY
jgi:hypothetical protein